MPSLDLLSKPHLFGEQRSLFSYAASTFCDVSCSPRGLRAAIWSSREEEKRLRRAAAYHTALLLQSINPLTAPERNSRQGQSQSRLHRRRRLVLKAHYSPRRARQQRQRRLALGSRTLLLSLEFCDGKANDRKLF